MEKKHSHILTYPSPHIAYQYAQTMYTHMHTHAHILTFARTHSHTQTCRHTRAHAYKHTHSHTDTPQYEGLGLTSLAGVPLTSPCCHLVAEL